jgi:osmotically-inducible protein OsmY
VGELLAEVLPGESVSITVGAHGGIVTFTGSPLEGVQQHDPLAAAIDLAWDIDGVVDVIDHVSATQSA